MLMLTRKPGERIRLKIDVPSDGNEKTSSLIVWIVIAEIKGKQARLGIDDLSGKVEIKREEIIGPNDQ